MKLTSELAKFLQHTVEVAPRLGTQKTYVYIYICIYT